MKRYPDTHPKDLAPHFSQHMEAMTAEALHDKGDIAVQLAWRDKRIVELEAMLERFEYMVRSLRKSLHESLDCDHIRQSCEDIGCPGAGRRKLIDEASALLKAGER